MTAKERREMQFWKLGSLLEQGNVRDDSHRGFTGRDAQNLFI
jgi:hypothetical protein